MDKDGVYLLFAKKEEVDPSRVSERIFFTYEPALAALMMEKGMRVFQLKEEDEIRKIEITTYVGEEKEEENAENPPDND
jgi:hypothetical protein